MTQDRLDDMHPLLREFTVVSRGIERGEPGLVRKLLAHKPELEPVLQDLITINVSTVFERIAQRDACAKNAIGDALISLLLFGAHCQRKGLL